jgi:hypothetical protein
MSLAERQARFQRPLHPLEPLQITVLERLGRPDRLERLESCPHASGGLPLNEQDRRNGLVLAFSPLGPLPVAS